MNKNLFHILVVDDDDKIRDLVRQYLEENQFLVTTAKDAMDARRKMEIIKFDILVLDIMMPEESGLSLTKVVKKIDSNAPHETFLVLDATTGQSAINQVEEFKKITPITGIIMTKLDGTAKGGILLAIGKKFKLPILALGMGEKENDLQQFNAQHFSRALMSD